MPDPTLPILGAEQQSHVSRRPPPRAPSRSIRLRRFAQLGRHGDLPVNAIERRRSSSTLSRSATASSRLRRLSSVSNAIALRAAVAPVLDLNEGGRIQPVEEEAAGQDELQRPATAGGVVNPC